MGPTVRRLREIFPCKNIFCFRQKSEAIHIVQASLYCQETFTEKIAIENPW
jgi:hypothetical protein